MTLSRVLGLSVSALVCLVVACDGDDEFNGTGDFFGRAGAGSGGSGGKSGSGGTAGKGSAGKGGTAGGGGTAAGGKGGSAGASAGKGGQAGTTSTGGGAGASGAPGEAGAAGASGDGVCAGQTLTGSCTWTNASECADFYDEDESVVMIKCPSSIGTFSTSPCETADTIGSCEKHLPPILGSSCEVFWYFGPTYQTQEISDGCPPPDTFHEP